MGRITNPYVLTALACTGGLLFGFDISSMSAIISSPNYLVYFGPKDQTVECPTRPGALCNPGPSADVQGGITASMAGGSFLASLFSGIIADRFGRRYAIFVGCILWVIGSILTCAVQNIAMLIVGRIFNGMCVGLCSAQVPVYLSELSPSRIRGRLVGCQQWVSSLLFLNNLSSRTRRILPSRWDVRCRAVKTLQDNRVHLQDNGQNNDVQDNTLHFITSLLIYLF